MRKVLDLYCGLGGASDGYARSGFLPTGIDWQFQRNYPYKFIQADVRDVLSDTEFLSGFDLVHASPPCQGYVDGHPRGWMYDGNYDTDGKFARQIELVRERLELSGVDWVIENVDTAPLDESRSVLLCGTWFRRDSSRFGVIRHRVFETNWGLETASECAMLGTRLCLCEWPKWPKIGEEGWVTVVSGTGEEYRGLDIDPRELGVLDGRYGEDRIGIGAYVARIALGISRGTKAELNGCIPPVYTEFIGDAYFELMSSVNSQP